MFFAADEERRDAGEAILLLTAVERSDSLGSENDTFLASFSGNTPDGALVIFYFSSIAARKCPGIVSTRVAFRPLYASFEGCGQPAINLEENDHGVLSEVWIEIE